MITGNDDEACIKDESVIGIRSGDLSKLSESRSFSSSSNRTTDVRLFDCF